MKTNRDIYIVISLISLVLSAAIIPQIAFANAGGFTGRTLMTSTQGCGSCHGTFADVDVAANIISPNFSQAGQTMNCFVLLGHHSKIGGGVNIACRYGTLTPADNRLHVENGELTNSFNIPFVNHIVYVPFIYTAPNFACIDSIFAIGVASNSDGTSAGDAWGWRPAQWIIVSTPTGITPISGQIPTGYMLSQNFPNPFNPSTTIKFDIPDNGANGSTVKLIVYNMLGGVAATLVDQELKPGSFQVEWNASNFSSGAYYYRLSAGTYSQTKRMILLK